MKHKIIQLLSAFGVASFLRNSKGEGITVLCLHKISNEVDHFFNPISTKQFEALVSYCVKHYSITTFSQIEMPTPKRKLILSFDDGYSDFLENAIPILTKFDVPCNHNVVNVCLNTGEMIWTQKLVHLYTHLKENEIKNDELLTSLGHTYTSSWLDYAYGVTNKMMSFSPEERDQYITTLLDKYELNPKEKMMTWEDVKRCEKEYKVEIGAHTYTHRTLNNVTEKEDLDFEIKQSILEIEDQLQHSVDIFCLPRGQYNETVIEYLREQTAIKYVLLVNDDTTTSQIKSFNLINRVYMINEPASEMILRTELFQKKMKRLLAIKSAH